MKQNHTKKKRKKGSVKGSSSKLTLEPFYKTLKTFHEEIPSNLGSLESNNFENTIAEIFKAKYKGKITEVKQRGVQKKVLYFKIDIIGKQGVGISTFVKNYCYNMFPNSYMNSVGVDFYLKEFSFNGTSCLIQIWTHSNEERFRSLRSASLAGTNGLIIIYDITDSTSLHIIHDWIPYLKAREINVPIMLLGNKCDLNEIRQVRKDEIMHFIKKNHIQLSHEISALTGYNLDFAFNKLLLSILERSIDAPSTDSTKNPQITLSTFDKIDKISKSLPKIRSKKKN